VIEYRTTTPAATQELEPSRGFRVYGSKFCKATSSSRQIWKLGFQVTGRVTPIGKWWFEN